MNIDIVIFVNGEKIKLDYMVEQDIYDSRYTPRFVARDIMYDIIYEKIKEPLTNIIERKIKEMRLN